MDAIGRVHRSAPDNRLHMLGELAQVLPRHKSEMEPWLLMEIGPRAKSWIEELESALCNGHNAAILLRVLPPLYEALDVADCDARTRFLLQRAIQLLIKDKQYAAALAELRAQPERQPKLEALCLQGVGDLRGAAQCHVADGNLKEALLCYRTIPDLDEALKLLDKMGEHPAAESLQWMAKVKRLVAVRPQNFTNTVTAAEKKLLQELLEKALGVSRPKAAPCRVARKSTAPRRQVPGKPEAIGTPPSDQSRTLILVFATCARTEQVRQEPWVCASIVARPQCASRPKLHLLTLFASLLHLGPLYASDGDCGCRRSH